MPNSFRIASFAAPILLAIAASAQAPFTLPQVLSAPFPSELQAAPALNRISWIADAEGRRNLWIADPANGKYTARQLTKYTEDDGIELGNVAWSPDAQQIAYARGTDFEAPNKPAANPALLPGGVSPEIFLVDIKSGQSTKVAEGRAPLFTSSGDALIYISNNQLWMVKLAAGKAPQPKPEQLLHTRGSIGSLRLSPDGSKLAFVSTRDNDGFIGVYDLGAKSLTYLSPSADSDMEPAWSPDSRQIAFIRTATTDDDYLFAPSRTAITPWSIRIADMGTGQNHDIPSNEIQSHEIWKAAAGQGSVFRALASDNQLLWTAASQIVFPSELDGWLHLYAVPTSGGTATLLTPGDFEVEHTNLSKDRTELVYSSNQGTGDSAADSKDIDRRHIWKLAVSSQTIGKPKAITRGEGIEVTPILVSDNRTVAVLRSDARLPMRPAIVTGNQLVDLNPEAIPKDFPAASLVVPQQVILSSADGMQIHGQLFLPPASSTTRHPALVFFHGGSRRQMLLGWHYMQYYNNAYGMNQYLASQGYVVLSVNYRSGIGYGLNFREALNYGADGASEFNDVLGAGLYLRNRPDVDPAHIGSWGGSYGGYLTALALARASDLFSAGVDFHGVHDWNIELGNWNTSYDPTADPNRSRIAYESSPISSVSTWRSPVLLIHGDDDRNVQFSQTPKLAAALRKQQVSVDELIFPDEIHDFLLHRDWLKAYAAETAFFAHHLQQ
ncbi:S9 family peptidase [Acidicapsa ligni]|uniref:S9 family peptidase n=1 Tax=Acidicapsa ligni TaxID=542300 RepID=UPI0021DF9ECF|nr:prolyl oligopeptidase family serine peptidase [Acidicapsa ligni]